MRTTSLFARLLLCVTLLTSLFGSIAPFALPITGDGQNDAVSATNALPDIESFVSTVANGRPGVITGVYVSNVMAYPVVQQPAGDPGYVAASNGVLTQFATASQYNTIGLLAHNYLAGASYSNLQIGQVVKIVYGDRSIASYQVTAIQRYQALSPESVYSDFVDPNDYAQTHLSSSDIFYTVYGPGNRLVFQTCIESNGDPSWGRLFITALPIDEQTAAAVSQPATTYAPYSFLDGYLPYPVME